MPTNNNNSDNKLYIKLENIVKNYRIISRKASNSITAAVVKADAYGLGAIKVSQKLYDEGCRNFFVATLDEALEIRNNIKKNAEIYVFHGLREKQESIFTKNNIVPVLNTLEEIKRWNSFCYKNNKKLPAIIHVDTGMNRLGLNLSELNNIKSKISDLKLDFVMSHMACADEKNNKKNKEQLKLFNKARKYFPGVKYSLANSPATFLDKCYHFDLVRPGSALYGVNPIHGLKNPMEHAIELYSKIIQIRTIDSEETVGYGATKALKKGSKIAVIPLGYADGYLRSLSNNGNCCIDGIMVPIVGRVSMDLIIIDVTKIPGSKLHIGKEVEVIGKNISIDEVAKKAGTIGYEVLTRLGTRFNRIYS